jgi:SAM-dependent methyltransferase
MSQLLASVDPSTSFDISYENYSRFLTFTDKHDQEATALTTELPKWVVPGGTISAVDVGSGSGRLAKTLHRIYSTAGGEFSLTLLEPAVRAAEALDEAFAGDLNVIVACQSLQEYLGPPQGAKHSLVLASHVNYYFEDRRQFFDAMLDLLQPGGVLCCISGAISLLAHPFYVELGAGLWQLPGTERSFGLDGYGSCAEELELIAFNGGHAFHTFRSPASLSCSATQVRSAIKALNSLDACINDELCRCFGFLLRAPVDVIFRGRHQVREFLVRHRADQLGMRIECEDKIMFLRKPGELRR